MDEESEEKVKFIDARWAQLHEIEKESADNIFRYLLLVNSGGAIATLSFLGASSVALGLLPAKLSLLAFLIGILLVGASYIVQFHYRSNLFNKYRKDVAKVFQNKLSFDELLSRDEERSIESIWHYILPYGSLAFFIVGCSLGTFALIGCGA